MYLILYIYIYIYLHGLIKSNIVITISLKEKHA